MKGSRKPRFHLPRWVESINFMLAAGRYRALWLSELTAGFEQILAEKGEEAAIRWLLEDLTLGIPYSVVARFLWIWRLIYRAYELYEKIARN